MIELYINNRLCDTDERFGIKIKRQFITPLDLQRKDAQASYQIILPKTDTNNAIFGRADIEESTRKFTSASGNKALLLVNGLAIFNGFFRLSEINRDSYIGNLILPAARGTKEIFGTEKLCENNPLWVPFTDFAASVTQINKKVAEGDLPPCIFPLTLYGLLKKTPKADGTYTSRNVWDEHVRLDISDLPPSINLMQMLKHIFQWKGYELTGDALKDEKLLSLYMSYQNDGNEPQSWNYGNHAIHIKGNWQSIDWDKPSGSADKFERFGTYCEGEKGEAYYTANIFDSSMGYCSIIDDGGGNILKRSLGGTDGERIRKQVFLTVPKSGYYKISLRVDMTVNSDNDKIYKTSDGTVFTCGRYKGEDLNSIPERRKEIKLLRDFGNGGININYQKMDRQYYKDNLNQNTWFNDDNQPKYFPQIEYTSDGKPREVMIVDPKQNENMITGFTFGHWGDWKNMGASEDAAKKFDYNPKLADEYKYNMTAVRHGTVLLGKNGRSWDREINPRQTAKIGMNTSGYWRWGFSDEYEDNEDEPEYQSIEEEEEKHSAENSQDGENETYGNIAKISADEAERTDKPVWQKTDKFKMNLKNCPESFARCGYIKGQEIEGPSQRKNLWHAEGESHCIAWLQAGEKLDLITTSDKCGWRKSGKKGSGWGSYTVEYDLKLEPFQEKESWMKAADNDSDVYVYSSGELCDWLDDTDMLKDKIDLMKFLPKNITVDVFIQNVCKAFNLQLNEKSPSVFSMDIKQQKNNKASLVVNLDEICDNEQRVNQSLNLPARYDIGFTLNDKEDGYVSSAGFGGNGYYETDSDSSEVVIQKSAFSYCWYKEIKRFGETLYLPNISEYDAWLPETDYTEAMKKRYFNLPLRFWYFKGLLPDAGHPFYFGSDDIQQRRLALAGVSNNLGDAISLNYENKPNSILDNYFTLLADASSHYTIVSCIITNKMYADLGNGAKAIFNGDLYTVAEIDGFDPTEIEACRIKLVKKSNCI